jgi:hypothetical protein
MRVLAERWTMHVDTSGERYSFTAPLDNAWQVIVRFRNLGSEIRFYRLEVLPLEEATAPPSSALFKKLRLGQLWRDMLTSWPIVRLHWPYPDNRSDELEGPSPGRRGKPAEHYALWTDRYVKALAEQPRTPIKLLVKRHPGDSAARIRAYLDKAESLGFLDRRGVSAGTAGGRKTAKCDRVLRDLEKLRQED